MIKPLLFFIIMSFFAGLSAVAQTAQKHPRVAELERFLAKEAFDYVKGRFPNEPVLVEVSIDPLRRNVEIQRRSNNELLPFDTSDSVVSVDEWDDPNLSLMNLIPRIRSANVKIILPTKITDAEVFELRDSLFSSIKLVYGRDKIDFERRDWRQKRSIEWIDLAMIAAILALFLPVLYLSIRSAASKVSKGIAEISGSLPSMASGGSQSSSPLQVSAKKNTSDDNSRDFRFNDPIKIAEKIRPIIDLIAEDPFFPDLEDIILLDEAIVKDAKQAGALVSIMPRQLQEKLFMLSFRPDWLDALSDPGELNTQSYEFANRLSQKDRQSENKEWEELLILIWRLDEFMVNFLQKLDQEEALAILSAMPSKLSIPTGKRALPGSWAALLDADFVRPILNDKRIGELQKAALEMKAYSDIRMLQRYRHEKGLIEYLKTASVRDEREVYEAARNSSNLKTLRPPFFPLLTSELDEIKSLVPRFPIEQWALALFNVNRDERGSFERALSEKQKYYFIESLKNLNSQGVSDEMIGAAREEIAKYYASVVTRKKIENLDLQKQGEEDVSENAQQAA